MEIDNLRAALTWANANDPALLLRLATALTVFWEIRGHLAEGRHWLDAALAKTADAEPRLRARAICGAGRLAWYHGAFAAARTLLADAVRRYRLTDDRQGIAMALSALAEVSHRQGELDSARVLLEECLTLSRQENDRAIATRSTGWRWWSRCANDRRGPRC